jgi:hypothetical protein
VCVCVCVCACVGGREHKARTSKRAALECEEKQKVNRNTQMRTYVNSQQDQYNSLPCPVLAFITALVPRALQCRKLFHLCRAHLFIVHNCHSHMPCVPALSVLSAFVYSHEFSVPRDNTDTVCKHGVHRPDIASKTATQNPHLC